MKEKMKAIASNGYWRTQVALGTALIAVSEFANATGFPGVDTSAGVGESVTSVTTNIAGIPLLLANASQIAGIWSGYMAWSNWQKVQKGNDSQATPGKSAAYVGGAVLGYFLPSVMGMGGATLLPGLGGTP